MRYGFGVDIGGTTIKLACFDQEGLVHCKWEIPTNCENGGAAILPDVAASVKEYLAREQIDADAVIGIGVGVPGPVDEHGIVNKCVNLGWGVTDLYETLSDLTGFPVRGGNDANVAALGECWKGSGWGCRNLVMATLGTGIGGGIVTNGTIVSGVHGAGGEIGHMVLNPAETQPCGCGKYGCAEQYCSATGVVQVARQYLETHVEESCLRNLSKIECRDVFDAAKNDDACALAILEQVYEYLGRFLANVCCITDPEVIVLGGGVSKAGKPLLNGIEKYFRKYAFHACRETQLVLASLGNDAGVYGAFKLALDAFGN